MFDDLIPTQGTPASAPARGMFDDLIPARGGQEVATPDGALRVRVGRPEAAAGEMSASDHVADLGRSLISGVDSGFSGLAGLPAFVGRGAQWATNQGQALVQNRPYEDVRAENNARAVISPETLEYYSPDAIHQRSGLAHKPQTRAGRYVETGAEFATGAALTGPANIARNAVMYGLGPGLASEAAGQATEGTALEPYARAGAAIAGGLTGAGLSRSSTAEGIVRRSGNLTPQQVDAVEALMRDAQAQGVQLTRAEAAQQVTGGATRLGDLQRVVEGQGGLREFMAARPGQVEAAGARQFDAIATAVDNPSTLGPAAGRRADRIVGDASEIINRGTHPLYQQADSVRVGPQIHAGLLSDDLYAQTLREVRNDPSLNRTIAHLPDDAVGVQHLVSRRLTEQADNARAPGQPGTSQTRSANFADAQAAPMAAAEMATGGPGGAFATAQAQQAALRQQYLDPLMAGPIGKIAGRDTTTRQAIDALFPANPLPNSAQEVVTAVQALSTRSPVIARQLVRTHAESVFNEATQAIQSGANQFGGATFAAAIRGNRQQAENLAAGIRALPGGDAILPGFDRLLDIMSATGQRQRIGSQTAFNAELMDTMRTGGNVMTTATMAAGAGVKWPAKVLERFQQWNLGRNTDEVARILTAPEAAPLFRHLMTESDLTPRAVALVSRITALGERGSNRGESR